MARVQVSTSSVNKNTSVAGNGVASGDGSLNERVRGSQGGFGVVGTDGSDLTTGNFEVLDALPAWYLRDLVEEREYRLVSGANPIVTRHAGGATTGTFADSDRGLIYRMRFRQNGENGDAVILGTTVLTDLDSDSDIVTIEVGDSIRTADGSGTIIAISAGNRYDIQIIRGKTIGPGEEVFFGKGTLVNNFADSEASALQDGDNRLTKPIPTS